MLHVIISFIFISLSVFHASAEISQEHSQEQIDKYRSDIESLLQSAQLPAEIGKSAPNSTQLYVFLTLGMPDKALTSWIKQTHDAGGIAVVRGFYGGKLSSMLSRLHGLQAGGVSVDPTAFSRFDVSVAPTVIISASPLRACQSSGCANDPTPPHDRISGNVSLEYALQRLALDGHYASAIAHHHLAKLGGGS